MDMNNPQIDPGCGDSTSQPGSHLKSRSLVVGITGGIATGKSTICAMFKELGAQVISADEIAHHLMEPETDTWRKIIAAFGDSILNDDKSINRRKLGAIVYADSKKLRRLEEIIHPHVLQQLAEKSAEFRANEEGILILEIPLLIETSSQYMVDKVIVAASEQKTQIERLINRYGISSNEALLRINSQISIKEKKKFADWVINTEESIISTKELIYRIWCTLQNMLAHTK
ncbi:MAG: dephospho-CoA kinase [Armatimonadota bacterium]